MVQNVERVRSELKIDPFCDWRALGKREIDVLESRPLDNIPSGISETTWVTDERRFIEKQVGCWMIQCDRLPGHEIRTIELEQASAPIREQRDNRAEGISRLQIHNR